MYVPAEKGVILCFVAGTEIHTSAGPVPVERLVPGIAVMSYDTASRREMIAEIAANHGAWANELVHVTVGGETIACTPEHPFWVIQRGWTNAEHLDSGYELRALNGDSIPVLGVAHERLCERVRIYNLPVNDTHTYFVGKSGLLVHNKKR